MIGQLPRPLALRLVNTQYVDRGSIRDRIGTPDGLREWLSSVQDLLSCDLTELSLRDLRESDMFAAQELRAAIGRLTEALVNGQRLSAAAIGRVNHRVAQIPRWVELTITDDGTLTTQRRSTAGGVAVALAEIAADAVQLFGTPTLRSAISVCQPPTCTNFYLHDRTTPPGCSQRCINRLRALSTGSITVA